MKLLLELFDFFCWVFASWWHHIKRNAEFFSADNKLEWLRIHYFSVMILVFTVFFLAIVLILITNPDGPYSIGSPRRSPLDFQLNR